jgi:hypothetical protein
LYSVLQKYIENTIIFKFLEFHQIKVKLNLYAEILASIRAAYCAPSSSFTDLNYLLKDLLFPFQIILCNLDLLDIWRHTFEFAVDFIVCFLAEVLESRLSLFKHEKYKNIAYNFIIYEKHNKASNNKHTSQILP